MRGMSAREMTARGMSPPDTAPEPAPDAAADAAPDEAERFVLYFDEEWSSPYTLPRFRFRPPLRSPAVLSTVARGRRVGSVSRVSMEGGRMQKWGLP